MWIPKNKYLTIPDAPNYEINGYFKVRNKITGRFLKLKKPKLPHHTPIAVLYTKCGKQLQRVVTSLYRAAKTYALSNEDFEDWTPIKSLDNRYEFNVYTNEVRNAVSKQKIKPRIVGNYVNFQFICKRKIIHKSLNKIRHECFGIPFKRKKQPVTVIVRQGKIFDGRGNVFHSIKDAAKFLAEKTFYCFDWIRRKMNKRQSEIFGWHLTYLGESL